MSLWSRIINRQGLGRVEALFVQNYGNTVVWPDDSNDTFTDSYTGNADVYTVINKIIKPGSLVPLLHIDDKGEEIKNSKTLALLENPSPFYSMNDLLESILGSYLIYGNAFINVLRPEGGLNAGKPIRLEVLPPPYTYIKAGTRLDPIQGYILHYGGVETLFDINDVFHFKEYNPDWSDNYGIYGMSPLKPILKSIVASDSGYQSMVSAFKNQGAHGVLTILGESLDDERKVRRAVTQSQISIIKNQFKPGGEHVGDENRGKIVATTKEVKWTPLGLSPVDLKILESMGVTKGAIADALGVPSLLLNGSQDRTYENYNEAYKMLWTGAIQPRLDTLIDKMGKWLIPQMGETGYLVPDYSDIDVLQEDKKVKIEWMMNAKAFTKNEIREAAGFDRIDSPEMDEVYISMGDVSITDTIPTDTEEILRNRRDYRANPDR